MMAIIHSCLDNKEKSSVLTYKWELEYEEIQRKTLQKRKKEPDDTSNLTPVYHIVSVDTIQKHCLVMPMHSPSRYVMQVVDQNKWQMHSHKV